MINGTVVLEKVADQLNIDLLKLVAGCAFWSPVDAGATKAKHPHIRRARSGEKPKTVTPEGIRLDDNTSANKVLKDRLSHLGKFEGFAVCHIWPQTCYQERYHTMPANLVLLPRELAGLTDHNRAVEQCLQYRAWELYGWYPEDKAKPKKPTNYPDNWREPAPMPIWTKPFGARATRSSTTVGGRGVLPITLNPSDPDAFRNAFIKQGRARISIQYKDGRVEEEAWLCQRFGPSSNVIGNLRSKPKFRSGMWQRLRIEKVFVSVTDEQSVAAD
jgi:hypothetical protein